jgi:hypothetical protein
MLRGRYCEHYVRAMLPERYLIAKRDVISLGTKYETQLFERPFSRLRWWHYIREAGWGKASTGPLEEFQLQKALGGFRVTLGQPTYFAGTDPKTGFALKVSSQINQFDIETIKGPQHLRRQLGAAAAYIAMHPQFERFEVVGGITHPAMGAFMQRLGFHVLELSNVYEGPKGTAYATHQAFRVVNGKLFDPIPYDEFQPVGLYMKNDEFIAQFSDPQRIWMSTPREP